MCPANQAFGGIPARNPAYSGKYPPVFPEHARMPDTPPAAPEPAPVCRSLIVRREYRCPK